MDKNQNFHDSTHQVDSTANTKISSSDANNNEYENGTSSNQRLSESQKADRRDFSSEQDRKLFVGFGNLGFSENILEDFFSQYGKVERVIIKRDVITAKPRGFAFITMIKPEDVEKIINACPLEIKGKSVDIKLAKSRPISKKVFVGGIDPNSSKDDIINYFSTFGKVIDIELPFDRMNKKRREFCFIIFDTEEAANQASFKAKQTILGCQCDVKKATPQPIAQAQKRQQNLQQSYNSQQSVYYNLNQSKNSKPFYNSPNSIKSGPSTPYRGGYRGNNDRGNNDKSANHRNSFSSGRRSIDSQHGTIYEYNNGNQSSFNNRKSATHYQSNRQSHHAANQYPQAGNQAKTYGNSNSKQQHQIPQQTNQIPQQTNQINNQATFYDQLAAHQNYYGYQMNNQMQFTNDYFTQQQYYSQPNAAANQYIQPNHMDPYYNQYAVQFYQQPAVMPTATQQQYANLMNQCYTNNYQSASAIDTPIQPTVQATASNTADYQTLDDHFYQEQQKQFENNLINSYEKIGSHDDVNYQLLNVPYQGPIQQC